tara:strand:+ start:911 stop:2221 length:1311 start_codon:yes stop_codon:yes gene_type:complete
VQASRILEWDGEPIGRLDFTAHSPQIEDRRCDVLLDITFSNEQFENLPIYFTATNLFDADKRTKISNASISELKRISFDITDERIVHSYDSTKLKIDLHSMGKQAREVVHDSTRATMAIGDPDIPFKYMVKPFLPEKSGVILYGSPKTGKSYLCGSLGISVDAGYNGIWPVEKAKVMYVNLERNEDSMRRRLGQINRALGMNPRRPLLMYNANESTLKQAYASIAKDMVEHEVKLVIIDSLTQSGYGDFNDNRVGAQVIKVLNRLIKPTGASYLAIGHTPKSDENTLLGAQSQIAGADVMVSLKSEYHQRNKKQLGIMLKMVRQNDSPPLDSPIITLEWDTLGLRTVGTGDITNFSSLMDQENDNRDPIELIEDYLQDHGPQTVGVIHQAIVKNDKPVRNTVSQILNAWTAEKKGAEAMFTKKGPKKTDPWDVIRR